MRLHLLPSSGSQPAPSRERDDAELVRAVQAGDVRAAGQLYDRLRPVIESGLRRILHSARGDFEDLAQICFEQVFVALSQGRFEGRSQLSTWVNAIAGHVALDALRRRVREEKRAQLGAAQPAVEIRSDRRLEARSELQRLHDILSRMPPKLAEALVLHDVFGHEIDEIAMLTSSSVRAAQSRLFRARKELLRRAGHPKGAQP